MARAKKAAPGNQFKTADVLAEARRIATEARTASVPIDWSVSARTPLEWEVRSALLYNIQREEFANRPPDRKLSEVALRIRQRLLDLKDTVPDDSETVAADLNIAERAWFARHERELERETKARQDRLSAQLCTD
jgi:hypothetical protein